MLVENPPRKKFQKRGKKNVANNHKQHIEGNANVLQMEIIVGAGEEEGEEGEIMYFMEKTFTTTITN